MDRSFVQQLESEALAGKGKTNRFQDFLAAVDDLLEIYTCGFKIKNQDGVDFRSNLSQNDRRKIEVDRHGANPWM